MKISVITATHNRHEMLIRAIKSVKKQTFTDYEHIVISDGPDPKVVEICNDYGCKVIELGRNWHSLSGNVNCGGMPKMVGTYVAKGDYIAYLDDDNEYIEDHLDLLYKTIIRENCHFVFSKMLVTKKKTNRERDGGSVVTELGGPKPELRKIDTNLILHKWELICAANWRGGVDSIYIDDWELISKWLSLGATWYWIDQPTVKYYLRH